MDILIIDDSEDIRDYCEEILKDQHKLTLVDTAKKGINQLKEKQFDLVLLDLRLPDKNGFDVLKEIKKHLLKCPVIIMSSFTTLHYQTQAEKLGAEDYIVKPFTREKLLDSIKKVKK